MLITSGTDTIKSQVAAVKQLHGGDKIIARKRNKELDLFWKMEASY
jgi:hypothetical protein